MYRRGEVRKVRVLCVGCGNTGKLIAEYVGRHGGIVCAAVDSDPALLGNEFAGVHIGGDLAAALEESRPDAAVVSVGSRLKDVRPLLETCLKAGVDTITTSEEALFPFSSDPETASYLDALAKEHRCTLTASGFQDCFWLHSLKTFAASMSRIDRISGFLRYDVDEYGPSLAADHGVGLTVKEFNERFQKSDAYTYILNSIELLSLELGWGPVNTVHRCTPYVHHEPLYSVSLEKRVDKGLVTGMSSHVWADTVFGGVIEAECVGKIYTAGDHDVCRWKLTGEPSLSFEVRSPDTLRHTAAAVVNRIPQLMRAEPGYKTIDRLGESEYLTFPMFLYL